MKVLPVIALAVTLALAGWLWTPDLDRATLEARYARSPADFIEVAGIRLHVRREGPADAPAVVLLHGFGASLQSYDAWAAALGADYHVIRYDLPGAGLTGPDPSGDYSDARSIEVLTALLDALGIERAIVAGHSIGGRMAWRFAAARPDRVSRLVLIAPDGFASPGFEYGKAPAVPAALNLMRHVLPKTLLRMNVEPGYAQPGFVDAALLARYHDLLRAPGVRQALLDRMRQTVLVEPRALLAQIPVPTLLLWGEADRLIPIANAQDYLAALPQAKLVSLPGIGHLPHEEAPAATVALLREFIGSPASPADTALAQKSK